MKERDPDKLSRIAKAVGDALADLLAYLKAKGLKDWLQRYSEIQIPLERCDYAAVVELMERHQQITHDEADRMDLLCHSLDTPPAEEQKRLARGHAKFGEYYRAFYRTFLLSDLCDRCLRVYVTYGLFNDPEKIKDDNNRIQAIAASAPKPDS